MNSAPRFPCILVEYSRFVEYSRSLLTATRAPFEPETATGEQIKLSNKAIQICYLNGAPGGLEPRQLSTEVSTQTGRVVKIKALIADAERRIAEEVKAFAVPSSGYTPEERTFLQKANGRQSAAVRLRIRKETDAVIIPILK